MDINNPEERIKDMIETKEEEIILPREIINKIIIKEQTYQKEISRLKKKIEELEDNICEINKR